MAPAVSIESLTAAHWRGVEAILLEGIADGEATFETASPGWEAWDRAHLDVGRFVAIVDGVTAGWSALGPVSTRACYAGVAEVSVYVARAHRGRSVGETLLRRTIEASESAGIWTLQGATFVENHASLRLQERCGFRVVGYRERIGQLGGRWRTTVLTERRSRIVGWEG